MRQLVLRLILLSAAATAVLTVAAAMILRADAAQQRERLEADADAAAMVSLLEVTSDEEALLRGIGRTTAGRAGRLAVDIGDHRIGTSPIPQGTAAGPAGDVTGGVLLRRAAPGAVVEVFVPTWQPNGSDLLAVAALAGAAAVGAALAAWAGSRRMRPVWADHTALIGMARDAGHDDRPPPTHPMTTPETVALGAALHSVAARIDDARSRERRIVADLSHRLRTPLTALALDASSIGDGPAADRVRNAIGSLDDAVDTLIRAVPAVATGPVQCDVVEVVQRRMAFWVPLGHHGNRHATVSLPGPPATIAFPADDLAAVVDALMGNIFRYTPAGTDFAVSVVRHAGWISLVVDDAGQGFADPAAALRRGVSGTGSTGLGLAIARDAVEATGGTIHVERSALGGARLRLRFAEVGRTHHDPHEPRAWRLWRNPRHERGDRQAVESAGESAGESHDHTGIGSPSGTADRESG